MLHNKTPKDSVAFLQQTSIFLTYSFLLVGWDSSAPGWGLPGLRSTPYVSIFSLDPHLSMKYSPHGQEWEPKSASGNMWCLSRLWLRTNTLSLLTTALWPKPVTWGGWRIKLQPLIHYKVTWQVGVKSGGQSSNTPAKTGSAKTKRLLYHYPKRDLGLTLPWLTQFIPILDLITEAWGRYYNDWSDQCHGLIPGNGQWGGIGRGPPLPSHWIENQKDVSFWRKIEVVVIMRRANGCWENKTTNTLVPLSLE